HLDEKGNARMVDVTRKAATVRTAVARGKVLMQPGTLKLIEDGAMQKGDVLGAARIAGVMAAKRTSDLIPLCHPLMLTDIDVQFSLGHAQCEMTIEATVRTVGKTGVEMEAMTAVGVAALTIYDMCKAVDRQMIVSDIKLVSKRGGKSGIFKRKE
ncbi:MAG: cyclic pyranopterin monophosphate synthase MoaC, partial [Syntrophus sp. (in: bacteria)]|nr:cyclic pyranopterin monophosphate synthase MoaC [Syntrophus sp. (in: bacteria)]